VNTTTLTKEQKQAFLNELFGYYEHFSNINGLNKTNYIDFKSFSSYSCAQILDMQYNNDSTLFSNFDTFEFCENLSKIKVGRLEMDTGDFDLDAERVYDPAAGKYTNL